MTMTATSERPAALSLLDALEAPNEARVFVHSTMSLERASRVLAVTPGLERYAERALLLARPGDVVCTVGMPDADYVVYLAGLGIGPSAAGIVALPAPANGENAASLSERLSRSDVALRAIGRALPPDLPLRLYPYVSSGHEAALAAALGRATGRMVRLSGAGPRLVHRVDAKQVVREAALSLGIPVAPGEVVELRLAEGGRSHDVTPVRTAIERWAEASGQVIVRGAYGSSGSSTFVVDGTPGSVDAALRRLAANTDNYIYLVEAMMTIVASPNVQMHIGPEPESIMCVGVTDQRLTPALVHAGNRYPSECETVGDMIAGARTLSRWLHAQGYTGLVGFDFVEYVDVRTGRPAWFLAELNPRVNGATYPVAVFDRLQRRAQKDRTPRPAAFMSGTIATRARSFAELRHRCTNLLFDPRTGRGAVPFNVGCLEQGRCGIVMLGPSAEAAARDYAVLGTVLGAEF